MYPAFRKQVASRLLLREESFLSRVVRWSWLALIAACVFQVAFFASTENFIALGCVIFAWAIIANVYLKPSMLRGYPLSAFLIIGFAATQFYFPLVFTTLEGKSIVFNLDLPYAVFIHSVASLIVLALGHFFYRLIAPPTRERPNSLLDKAGFFDPPTDLQLWLMGFIGLAATFYVYLYSPTIGWEVTGSASDKTIQGFIPFSYAPFFIPFSRMYGREKTQPKRLIPMLLGFTVLLFIVSIGRNSRGAFMLGFTSVGFTYAFGLLLGEFKTEIFTVKNAVIGLVGFLLVTGPIADLGTAMVIVRNERNDISSAELIDRTLVAFNDKEAIQERRKYDNTEKNDWDERYLDNIFTARFSNLKFNDASLVQAVKIGEQDPDMLKYSTDYILGSLPTPVLTALDLDVDKEAVYGVSIGDYLYSKAGGPTEALGGFRTGHFAGTGMAAFGWWYLLILGAGMIPVYFLFDKLVIKKKPDASTPGQPHVTLLRFSICGMLSLTSIFQFLPAESVVTTATFLLRGWPQEIFLYFLIYHFTRLLSVFVPGTGTPRLQRIRRLAVR